MDYLFETTLKCHIISNAVSPSLTGGSDDWAAGSLGIPFSYTVELPDTGRHGFLLPANKIESVGREVFAGFEAMVRELIRTGGQ